MLKLDSTMEVPLTQWDDGSIRIRGSRLLIDLVLHHFNQGATPEQILSKFPSVTLAEIYGAITYYLTHKEAMDQYLQKREAEARAFLQQLEADPIYQQQRRDLRERLRTRWEALQREKASSNPE